MKKRIILALPLLWFAANFMKEVLDWWNDPHAVFPTYLF